MAIVLAKLRSGVNTILSNSKLSIKEPENYSNCQLDKIGPLVSYSSRRLNPVKLQSNVLLAKHTESKNMDISLLKSLEKKANNGRGVICVKSIITYLELNRLEEAAICARVENDKLRNYPEIRAELFRLLPAYRKEQENLEKLFRFRP